MLPNPYSCLLRTENDEKNGSKGYSNKYISSFAAHLSYSTLYIVQLISLDDHRAVIISLVEYHTSEIAGPFFVTLLSGSLIFTKKYTANPPPI